MFRRLIWIHLFYHFLAIRLYHDFYLSLIAILTSHFSNITYFRQQQQQNKRMKYYEILPTHTETSRDTTRKIANLYIEFNCHFLTLQKKNPITFEQECTLFPYCAMTNESREYIWIIIHCCNDNTPCQAFQ